MAYQVLARKWRPSNFSQLVGQEHVSQSLIHALKHNRLHHAYLFTGTRGVGKTTVARILAKAINCEALDSDCNPCGQCQVCRDFEQGRFMDLIEVDAASRTKVEDTRDLLDNVQYTPNQGRYKVYLIDEVHMLSNHSFNALLKTLEEPPEHVKFLLATTDPHKIPVTVLSRCLQFNLKRLLPDQIDKQMQFILDQENIAFDHAALKFLARAADGSLRDALSLLDQAIIYGSGSVNLDAVTGMLGTVAQQPIEEILEALSLADVNEMMVKISKISELTPDFADILQQVLRVLHRVALLQHLPEYSDNEFDKQFLLNLAKRLTPEDVQLFYQIGLIGQRDLALAPDPRCGFEMVMLRMLTFQPKQLSNANAVRPSNPIAAKKLVASEPESKPSINTDTLKPQALEIATVAPSKVEEPRLSPESENWPEIIAALNLTGMSKQLANNCLFDGIKGHECHLQLDPNFKQVGRSAEEKLKEALEKYFAKPLKLIFSQQTSQQLTPALQIQKAQEDKQQAAIDSIDADKNIHDLKETFAARIITGSIEPLN